MAGDASGVLDTTAALAGPAVTVPVEATPAATVLSCASDGVLIDLPLDPEALREVLHRTYLVGGFRLLRLIHDAALPAMERRRDGTAAALLTLDAALADADRRIGEARQKIGDVGDQSENRQGLSDALFRRLELEATTAVERQNRQTTLNRLVDFRNVFAEAIADLADAEEEVQRWYEAKILAVMAADFQRYRSDLAKAWQTYRITPEGSEVSMAFDDAKDPKGLRLRGGGKTAPVKVAGRPKPGEKPTVQGRGTERTEEQPEVLVAVHELAQAEFAYKRALQARRGRVVPSAETPRPTNGTSVPAWPKLKAYREAIAKWAEKHPIALAAHRGLITVPREIIFDRKVLEEAVIGAMILARDEMPKVQRKVVANRLFERSEAVAAPADGMMTRQAAETLVAEKFVLRDPGAWSRRSSSGKTAGKPGSGTVGLRTGGGENNAAKTVPDDIDIYFCPWVLKPFHDRLVTLGAAFRHEATEGGPATAKPVSRTTQEPQPLASAEEAEEAAEEKPRRDQAERQLFPDPTDPVLFKEVAHLRELFANPEDRQRLDWVTGTANLSSRARLEAISIVETLVAEQKEMRDNVRLAVSAAGLGLMPFTGGKSLLLAGVIHAALVAGETSVQIQTWMAAKQLSSVVLDQMTAAYWARPDVALMIAIVLESGFEIATDLVTTGAASTILDAIGAALLVGNLVASVAVPPEGRAR